MASPRPGAAVDSSDGVGNWLTTVSALPPDPPWWGADSEDEEPR